MKIFVNAITSKMGGFKTLINALIESIDENDGNEYEFLVYKGSIDKNNYKKKNINIEESLVGDMNHIKRFFWYQIKLPKLITQKKYDVMLNLTNYGPLFPKCKEILLLHNPKHVSKEIYLNMNTINKLKLMIEDFVFKISLKGSSKLIVQTDYMKKGVLNKFKYDEDRIYVIPNCPSKIVKNDFDVELDNRINQFILDNKNVLVNITLYSKHKNLELLLKAVKYIKENNLCNFKLLMTISKDECEEAAKLIDMIKEYSIEDYVLSLGNINNKNIYQLLEKADAFVFPSYAETLGLPFIEAMRFGLPIIAADLGFAHDVCDNAALYFKYDNEKELANKIVLLFSNKELRRSLSDNSKVRSMSFKEKEAIERYLKLFN